MTEELTVDGRLYISSKRAAQLSQYTQDYVGQLCRGGFIDAQRIGGLWYVQMESLTLYKQKAENYVPQPPQKPLYNNQPTDTLISFDGKDYISAPRASEITGYHQDYVGQLAREGKVISRQVGNRWYVQREDLLKHKEEKDRLLAAVQSQAVGIPAARAQIQSKPAQYEEPLLTYSRDDGALIPHTDGRPTEKKTTSIEPEIDHIEEAEVEQVHVVPIRVAQRPTRQHFPSHPLPPQIQKRQLAKSVRTPRKTMNYAVISLSIFGLLAAILLAVFILAGGPKQDSRSGSLSSSSVIVRLGDIFEKYVTTELIYRRSDN